MNDREPIIHDLKCWPEYFEAVARNEKTFEVRKWDRPYRVEDTLWLREWDKEKLDYTGRSIYRTITYLLDMTYLPGDNIPHFSGYVVMGLNNPTIAQLQASLAEKEAQLARAVECIEEVEYSLANSHFLAAWTEIRKWRYADQPEEKEGE